MNTLIGAIEAGGTKFVCAVARDGGEILAETRIPTTTPTQTLDAAQRFLAEASAETDGYSAIGIASFGPLDLRPSSASFGHLVATPKPG